MIGIIAQEKNMEDCAECKAIGTGTFACLAAYSLYLRQTTSVRNPRQRLFLTGMVIVSGALAFYRAKN